MIDKETIFWEVFETWSPWGLIVAGIGFLLLAVFNGLPEDAVPIELGILTAHIGALALSFSLIGYYPRLKDSEARLALGGVICIGFVLVDLLVFPIALLGVAVPLGAPVSRLPNIGIAGGAFSIISLIFLLPIGSILFGAASLRSPQLPKTHGYLLLALALPFLTLVSHALLSTPSGPDWARWLAVALLALALAYFLHTTPAAREDLSENLL